MPLNVLSFNVFGVFHAADVPLRMPLIGSSLAPYEVVCLQEQFDAAHCELIQSKAPHLKHCHRFVSSPVGSGLTLLSKYPITQTTFIPFRCPGSPERFWEGDYFANKGIAVAKVRVPAAVLESRDDVELVVINTHMIAQYERMSVVGVENEKNAAWRLAQALQVAQVASLFAGQHVLVCGDLNCSAGSLQENGLRAYSASHGMSLSRTLTPGADSSHTLCDSNMYNTHQTGYLGFMNMQEDFPTQLDHVLHSHSLVPSTPGRVVLQSKAPSAKGPINLSDHYGVAVSFVAQTAYPQTSSDPEHVRTALRVLTSLRSSIASKRRLCLALLPATAVLSLFVAMPTPFAFASGAVASLFFAAGALAYRYQADAVDALLQELSQM